MRGKKKKKKKRGRMTKKVKRRGRNADMEEEREKIEGEASTDRVSFLCLWSNALRSPMCLSIFNFHIIFRFLASSLIINQYHLFFSDRLIFQVFIPKSSILDKMANHGPSYGLSRELERKVDSTTL